MAIRPGYIAPVTLATLASIGLGAIHANHEADCALRVGMNLCSAEDDPKATEPPHSDIELYETQNGVGRSWMLASGQVNSTTTGPSHWANLPDSDGADVTFRVRVPLGFRLG